MDGAIKKASDRLEFLATDKTFLHELHLREIALSDYNSAISYAEEKGIEKGIEKGRQEEKIEMARNLLDVLDDKTISEKSGLPLQTIEQLRSSQGK